MAGIAVYAEKAMLDWVLLGATPTRPTALGVNISLGSPSSVSASEVALGSGITRQAVSFAPADSPAGSGSNTVPMTFGPVSGACSVSGISIWDTASPTNGNYLWYGLLSTVRTLGVGDSLVIAAGELTITLR
jgi:hypothetical protein